jgi:serine/threonine protein phosphatase PrpC
MLSDEIIRRALAEVPDVSSAAKRLVDLANGAGGLDNVTVILVRNEALNIGD